MSRVLWHVTMSVDGFIAGPGGSMDWVFRQTAPIPEAEDAIPEIGAALTGRRTYENGRGPKGPKDARRLYGDTYEGPIFVLTHDPPAASDDPAVTFVSGSLQDAVDATLAAADGRDVVLLGADVARQCLEAGLVDDLLVHVAPVLLGDGVRLFSREGPPVRLQPASVTRAGEMATMRFLVVP